MKIIIRTKSVYGIVQAYPACAVSRLFADLTGTKTLTREALNTIKKLGFAIEQQAQTMDIWKIFLGHAWQVMTYLIQHRPMQHITNQRKANHENYRLQIRLYRRIQRSEPH